MCIHTYAYTWSAANKLYILYHACMYLCMYVHSMYVCATHRCTLHTHTLSLTQGIYRLIKNKHETLRVSSEREISCFCILEVFYCGYYAAICITSQKFCLGTHTHAHTHHTITHPCVKSRCCRTLPLLVRSALLSIHFVQEEIAPQSMPCTPVCSSSLLRYL